jgi:hypothetical protein
MANWTCGCDSLLTLSLSLSLSLSLAHRERERHALLCCDWTCVFYAERVGAFYHLYREICGKPKEFKWRVM